MHVEVNAVRLWFDVEGLGMVWDGTEHRRRPTVVLVHGGPGSLTTPTSRPTSVDWPRSPRSSTSTCVATVAPPGDPEEWTLRTVRRRRPVVLRRSRHRPTRCARSLDGRADRPALRSPSSRPRRWDRRPVRLRPVGRRAVGGGVHHDRGRRGRRARPPGLRRRGAVRRGRRTRLRRVRDPRPGRAQARRLPAEPRPQPVGDGRHTSDRHPRPAGGGQLADTGLRGRAGPGHAGRRVRGDRGRAASGRGPFGGDPGSGALHLARRTRGLLACGHRLRPSGLDSSTRLAATRRVGTTATPHHLDLPTYVVAVGFGTGPRCGCFPAFGGAARPLWSPPIPKSLLSVAVDKPFRALECRRSRVESSHDSDGHRLPSTPGVACGRGHPDHAFRPRRRLGLVDVAGRNGDHAGGADPAVGAGRRARAPGRRARQGSRRRRLGRCHLDREPLGARHPPDPHRGAPQDPPRGDARRPPGAQVGAGRRGPAGRPGPGDRGRGRGGARRVRGPGRAAADRVRRRPRRQGVEDPGPADPGVPRPRGRRGPRGRPARGRKNAKPTPPPG